MTTHKIFFSWQEDTPAALGKTLIQQAIKGAIKELTADLAVEPSVRQGLAIDHDTTGVAGTPPIVDTIFRKIDAAAIFVADLTFVAIRRDGRPSPNPNVLLEYGWALRSLGYGRIICIMNTAYGEPKDETLPFNMKHLRWPRGFHLVERADAETIEKATQGLKGHFKLAIRTILESTEFRDSLPSPAALPPFQARDVIDPPARFRKRGEPIGVTDSRFGLTSDLPITLAEGPALWLRVMPVNQLSREWSIAQLRETMARAGLALLPLGWGFSTWSFLRASDGFGYYPQVSRNIDQVVPAVSLAFKSGEIWTVYAGPIGTPQEGTFVNIEHVFTETLLRCVRFMREGLEIALPYRWIAGIEGIKGKRMQCFARPGHTRYTPYSSASLDDVVSDSGVLSVGDTVALTLRPFFRKIYDSCGEARGDYMDDALLRIQV